MDSIVDMTRYFVDVSSIVDSYFVDSIAILFLTQVIVEFCGYDTLFCGFVGRYFVDLWIVNFCG